MRKYYKYCYMLYLLEVHWCVFCSPCHCNISYGMPVMLSPTQSDPPHTSVEFVQVLLFHWQGCTVHFESGTAKKFCPQGSLRSTWAERRREAKRQRRWGGCGRGFPSHRGGVWGASLGKILALRMSWEWISGYLEFIHEQMKLRALILTILQK